jgi:hypothetical protein
VKKRRNILHECVLMDLENNVTELNKTCNSNARMLTMLFTFTESVSAFFIKGSSVSKKARSIFNISFQQTAHRERPA